MTDKKTRILPTVQKPARYTGGEWGEVRKNKGEMAVRVAFCFPDTYEIGMSNVGMRILYGVMNQLPDVWCERVFAPWGDMEEAMVKNGLPLWALESQDPVKAFDMVAFTIGSSIKSISAAGGRLEGLSIISCSPSVLVT